MDALFVSRDVQLNEPKFIFFTNLFTSFLLLSLYLIFVVQIYFTRELSFNSTTDGWSCISFLFFAVSHVDGYFRKKQSRNYL